MNRYYDPMPGVFRISEAEADQYKGLLFQAVKAKAAGDKALLTRIVDEMDAIARAWDTDITPAPPQLSRFQRAVRAIARRFHLGPYRPEASR